MIVRGARDRRGTGSTRGWRLFVVAGGALGAVAACSLAIDAGRNQCTTNAECVGHLGQGAVCAANVCEVQAPPLDAEVDAMADAAIDASGDAAPIDPAWDCVGTEIPANVPVHVYARYRRFASAEPISGLPVSGCPTTAVDCSPPLNGTPKDTDEGGLFEVVTNVSVLGGFRGSLETAASGAFPTLLPSILSVKAGQPNTQSLEDAGPDRPRYPTDLLTSDDLQGIADALGTGPQVDLEAGHLSFAAINCQGELAADVTVTSDFETASTRLVYLDANGRPDKSLKKTSSSGRGIFLNLPVAQLTIKLIRADGVRAATQALPSRKGTVSYAFLGPSR